MDNREITEKGLKWTKKVENRLKKMFWTAFGCAQHPKAGLKYTTRIAFEDPLKSRCLVFTFSCGKSILKSEVFSDDEK